MKEKRYSFGVAGEYLRVSPGCIQYNAKKLDIDSSRGLTAKDVMKIKNYLNEKTSRPNYRSSLEELKEEIEENE